MKTALPVGGLSRVFPLAEHAAMATGITSLAEFIGELSALQSLRRERHVPLWFRGQSGDSQPLVPRFLRGGTDQIDFPTGSEVDEEERQLLHEFRSHGVSLLPRTSDLIDVYLLAQHHGLPTRLLDWSENPLAALFFAVNRGSDQDGELVVLAVDHRLRPDSDDHERVLRLPVSQRHPLVQETVHFLFDGGDLPTPQTVLPFRPDLHAGRMFQQHACFTLHMPGSGPIREFAENSTRLRIPALAKPQLVEELALVGVNWASLFPDLDHLARHMRGKYGL
jgi:hypothetical protein